MDGMEKLSRRFRTLLRPRLRLARPGFYFLVAWSCRYPAI